jgi:murein DD-endopeptidase MepM/ murein hydrolase activator NlpD
MVIVLAAINQNSVVDANRFTTNAEPEVQRLALPNRVDARTIEPLQRNLSVHIERIKPGDNLAVIFKRLDLSSRELLRLLDSGPLAKGLTQIYPGHELTFVTDSAGNLVQISYSPGPLERMEFERAGNTYKGREVFREPEAVNTYRHAMIEHSLFIASQRAGLNDSITMRLAQIFQWDIDFVLDIRKGDEFHVLYQELYVGNEFIGFGEILAAEFVNQDKHHRVVRYVDSSGLSGYYNPLGENMRKEFLRAPLAFTRISSNFNLKRKHPVFKKSVPHRGIDYTAPVGTPVLAAGNGKIVAVQRNKANGNYIVIQHGEQFQTKYLHLSKFARNLSKESRVTQGQVIGYVGATGYATGPHLHYEFLVNGVHRNARTIDLPKATPIPAAERERFEKHTQPMFTLLESYRQDQQLAVVR